LDRLLVQSDELVFQDPAKLQVVDLQGQSDEQAGQGQAKFLVVVHPELLDELVALQKRGA
jgi:hypothetical protein